MHRQRLWIRPGFNPDEGFLPVPVPVPAIRRHPWRTHVHNNVFQLCSSLITSSTMPLYRNAQRISNPRCLPISHKNDEHTEPPSHFYTEASMEKDDARFENLGIP